MGKQSNMNVDASIVMQALEKQATPAIKKVNSLVVNDHESYTQAGELMKGIKEIAKIAKEREDQFTVPLNKLLTDIRSLFKPFRDNVKMVEQDTKDKMLKYLESTKKEVKKLEEKFDSGEIKKVSTLVSKTAALQIGSNVRKVWEAVPVNVEQTPREYLVPDEAKIKDALKSGKTVKGWKWEQVEHIII